MNKILEGLKCIKIRDLFSPLLFLLAIIPALFYRAFLKIAKKPLWLICESGDTARDNGYYFYRYMRKEHPEVNCKYVITKKSSDYKKITELGAKPVRPFGLTHYILYLSAKWNISNHKNGNPNQILFYILHVTLGLYRNRVFLQHGVIKDYLPYIYYKSAKFTYFVTSSEREYKFVSEEFGYPKGSIIFTGLPRFDTLVDTSKEKKQLLIMPTWRNWLGRDTNSFHEVKNFNYTDYYKNWNSLITSKRFIEWIEANDIQVLFYPHLNMQKFLGCFESKSKNIKITNTNYDIQKALRESFMLLTDYSSVYMDFAYMRKPVVYFQFDYKEYRERQHPEGYFNYKSDGFGPIFTDPEKVLDAINLANTKKSIYKKRCDDFFPENDYKNSERIYNILTKSGKR